MKHALLFLFSWLAVMPASARPAGDTLLKRQVYSELAATPDDRVILALKCRKLLLSYLDENNLEKVDEMIRFIASEVESEDFLALLPSERLLLFYRRGDHEGVARYLGVLDTISTSPRRDHLLAPDDLRAYLMDHFVLFRESYQAGIRCADLPGDMKELLCIMLDYLMQNMDPRLDQAGINAACHRFFTAYAGSPYERLVRMALVEWGPSNWSMKYAILGQYALPGGTLSDYFHVAGGVSVEWVVEFGRWETGIYISLSPSSVSRDVSYDGGTWRKGSSASLSHGGCRVNYRLYGYKRHAISPAVSLGYISVNPNAGEVNNDKSLKNAAMSHGQIGLGLQYDWRFYSHANANDYFTHGLRFQYHYTRSFASSKHILGGHLHEFRVGYLFSVSKSRRKH
ncbi:MAG: hypothetical protein LBP56_00035 [Odoribacteraceae bacterium]|jgi:hypothetical protein|nr:hypothetical protein [Odoribacteraceae bacterium]